MLMSCQKEMYNFSSNQDGEIDRFFSCSTRAPILDYVIHFLETKNDSLDFIPKFIEKYGMPSWDNSVYFEEDNKYLLVPFKNPSKEEIEGVWTFKIEENNYIHSLPVVKQKTSERDYWAFDYFTCNVLKKKPRSGLLFEDIVKTKAGLPEYKCVWSRIEIEFNGSIAYGDWKQHCWNDLDNYSIFGDDSQMMRGDIPVDYIGGGGGGAPGPNFPAPPSEDKNKNKLPNETPKTVIDDCNDKYQKIKNLNNTLLGTIKAINSRIINGNKKPSFDDFLTKVKSDPSHEHSMSIQNYGEDGLVAEPINTGTESSVLVVTTNCTCADIHNHPNNTPPSPRDLWVLVSNANASNNYTTRFIIGENGDYYAMNVTDQSKVKAFYEKYGSINKYIDSNHNFIEETDFQKDWDESMSKFKKLGENDAWCYALAYIMQKYDMGITMLSQKKDEKGFTSMHMKVDVDKKDSSIIFLIPVQCN